MCWHCTEEAESLSASLILNSSSGCFSHLWGSGRRRRWAAQVNVRGFWALPQKPFSPKPGHRYTIFPSFPALDKWRKWGIMNHVWIGTRPGHGRRGPQRLTPDPLMILAIMILRVPELLLRTTAITTPEFISTKLNLEKRVSESRNPEPIWQPALQEQTRGSLPPRNLAPKRK